MRVRWGTCFLFALFAAAAPAAGQSAPEMATHDQIVTFKTAVNLVNVPVVVRDSKGRAVGNLKQVDFQLFDRGKLQVISKFTVEKAEAAPDPAAVAPKVIGLDVMEPGPPASVLPERFVAYLFDDVHIKTNDLVMAREAADRHMKAALGPKVRAAIFTTSGQGMLDFTDDKAKLHQALFAIQPRPISETNASRDCPDLTYFWADRIRNQNDPEALRFATMEAIGCLHLRPDDVQPAGVAVRAAMARIIARTEQSSRVPLEVLRGAVQRISVMPGQRTLVLISPGFLTPNGTRNEQSIIIDRAIHANVVVNALDVRGLATETPDPGKPSLELPMGSAVGQYYAYRESADHEVFQAQNDVMAEIAAGTGGTFYHNSNDLDAGFQRVAAAPEYRYILGFSPQALKLDGSVHGLKVNLVKNPEHFELDARRSYTAPKRLDDPAEQAKQEITDAIFSREELRDIPLTIQSEFFKPSDARARVTVTTHVDLKALHLRKTEGRNRDDLTVTAALFDSAGNYAAAIQRGVELRLKDDTFDRWMANGILVQSKLEVKPGTYLIRVVVRDSEGQLLAARNGSIDIP